MLAWIELTEDRWWDLVLAVLGFLGTVAGIAIGAGIALRHDRRKRVADRSNAALGNVAELVVDVTGAINALRSEASFVEAGLPTPEGSLDAIRKVLRAAHEKASKASIEAQFIADGPLRERAIYIPVPLLALQMSLQRAQINALESDDDILVRFGPTARGIGDWYDQLLKALVSAARGERYVLPADIGDVLAATQPPARQETSQTVEDGPAPS